MNEENDMIVYCCPKCKMTDIGEENEQKNCMRCGVPMRSLGISSFEWNKMSSVQMNEAVYSCAQERILEEVPSKQLEQVELDTEHVDYSEEEVPQHEKTENAVDTEEVYSQPEPIPVVEVISEDKPTPNRKDVSACAPEVNKRNLRTKKAVDTFNIPKSSSVDNNRRLTKLSIAALVCSILGCMSVVGIILGIVDLIQGFQTNDGRKKGLSITAIAVGIIIIVGGFVGIVGNSANRYIEMQRETEAMIESTASVPAERPSLTLAPTEAPLSTPTTEPGEQSQEEVEGNGIDADEWPEVASLEMTNEQMLAIYSDYYAKIYSDEYPEDDMDAIDAYEEKIGKEIADKYGITPEQALLVYTYVSINYDKVANDGA